MTIARYSTIRKPRMLDPSRDLVRLGYAANVDVDGSNGGNPISDAIEHVLKNRQEFDGIILPRGTYEITSPIIVSAGSVDGKASFSHLIIEAEDFAYGSPPYGTRILFSGGDASTLPLLIIQGGKGCRFRGLTLESSGNPAPVNVNGGTPAHLFTTTRSDYISSGVRTNRRSPQCVVAVDPFTANPPDGVDANRYPSLEAYYGGASYPDPAGSSATVFEECRFKGGYFAIAMSPPGNASGADGSGPNDDVQNNESSFFIRCRFDDNCYEYGCGQNQARHIVLEDCHYGNAWMLADDEVIGPSGNNGIMPELRGGNIVMHHYVVNTLNLVAREWSGLHIESTKSLGKIGTGASSVHRPFKLTGCTIDLASAIAYAPNEPCAGYHLSTFGIVELDTCEISVSLAEPFRVWNYKGRFKMRNCMLRDNSVGSRVQVGFQDASSARGETMHVRVDGSARFDDDPSSDWTEALVGNGGASYEDVTITQDGTVKSTGTCTVSDPGNLAVGDLVSVAVSSATQYQPEVTHPDQSAGNYQGPAGWISDITGTTVTIKGLPKGFPFDTALKLDAFAWT